VAQYDPTTAAAICGIDEDTIARGATVCEGQCSDDNLDHGHQSKHAWLRWRGRDQQLNLITATSASRAAPRFPLPPMQRDGTRECRRARGFPATARWKRSRTAKQSPHTGASTGFFSAKARLVHDRHFSGDGNGQIKALWLCDQPMTSMPNIPRIKRRCRTGIPGGAGCVCDVETTKYAHVYLRRAVGEKEGVFTNTERRVNLVRK